jgi:hypothetical protein
MRRNLSVAFNLAYLRVKASRPVMSDKYSIEFPVSQLGGHPHDLLARLYREIGISAVAAALEVTGQPEEEKEAFQPGWLPLGEELAA